MNRKSCGEKLWLGMLGITSRRVSAMEQQTKNRHRVIGLQGESCGRVNVWVCECVFVCFLPVMCGRVQDGGGADHAQGWVRMGSMSPRTRRIGPTHGKQEHIANAMHTHHEYWFVANMSLNSKPIALYTKVSRYKRKRTKTLLLYRYVAIVSHYCIRTSSCFFTIASLYHHVVFAMILLYHHIVVGWHSNIIIS